MTSQATRAASPAPVSPVPPLLELRFFAVADRLKLVRPSVHAAALMCGFSDLTAHDIVLAVDEACQNIIVHGYGVRPTPVPEDGSSPRAARREITVAVFRQRDGVRITVRDQAAPVDPATIRPRDLDNVRPGGLGTHFIRQIMDHVDHAPGADGNTLELIKYHRPSQ